jgi:BolA protein
MSRERVARIEAALGAALAPERLEVADEGHLHRGHAGAAGGAGHFRVYVVSAAFEGLSRLQRHRKVYGALQAELGPEIHALAVTALTPGEAGRAAPR